MTEVRNVNYKNLHLSGYGIPTAKALMALMLNIASTKSFFSSMNIRKECFKHLIMPKDLKQLTFKAGTHPGTNRLDYTLNWTLHNLYFYGALSHVGYAKYQITHIGKRALTKCGYNSDKLIKFLSKYIHKTKSYTQMNRSKHEIEKTTNIYSNVINDISKLNQKLSHQLIETILHKNPYFFEKLVVQLLSKMVIRVLTESLNRPKNLMMVELMELLRKTH